MLIEIEDRCIEIARPEKWVWYEGRITILDLAKYYVAVSPWLLPHLRERRAGVGDFESEGDAWANPRAHDLRL